MQRDLRKLGEASASVQAFLPAYSRYLRAVARARAVAASEAERALRSARRRVVDAEAAVAAAEVEVERVRVARLHCEERSEIAGQRQRAVLESPAYRDARSLVEVEARAADVREAAAEAKLRLASATQEAEEAAAEVEEGVADVRAAEAALDRAFRAASESADGAGIGWPLARAEVEAGEVEPILRALSVQRRQDVVEVRAALARSEAAAAKATYTASAAARSATVVEEAEAARHFAASALDAAREALAADVRNWTESNAAAWLDPVLGAVELADEPGAPSLNVVVAELLQPRRAALAARDARAIDLAISLTDQRDEATAERQRLVDDPVPAPDPIHTRPARREGRNGAPLYACCDFGDDVADADRAELEAALEAAGLLDAWIGDSSDDLDAWLHPTAPTSGPLLSDVLVADPPEHSRLLPEDVREVLASIALADAGIAVLPDGRYHLGPLRGRFAKPEAEFIGVTAREQRRQRLLAQLDARIADLSAQLVQVADERAGVAAEQSRLDEIAATLPSSRPLLAARDALVRAAATAATRRASAAEDEVAAREARLAAGREQTRLRACAGEHGLPTTAEALDHSEMLVGAFDEGAHQLVKEVVRLGARQTAQVRVAARLERAQAVLSQRSKDHDDRQRQAQGLRARVDELRLQLGAEAEAPLQALAAIEDELRRLRVEVEDINGQAGAAAERRGGAAREHELAVGALGGHQSAARTAVVHLDVLRRPELFSVVAGRDAATPDGGPELATALLRATADVSAAPDVNALQRAYRQLLDDLGPGYDPGLTYVDDVAVVEVTSDSGTFSVLWLADELSSQLARQQELLSERDREIFERHLLIRVSEALRQLLNDADELVGRINRSLADRPTASGKRVQLRWELEAADPAVHAAVGLLRKTPELLGPDEREQLRRFFSGAINQRRAEDPAAGYAETLRHVLDYRTWHSFLPHVRSAAGGVQRLTRTVFRTLSGGEQAVVLHLPLFAAAAAHYDIAMAGAPRLIALDEAFAGIDEGMRADLMGLLVQFDLDVLLTGHELWGAYEQVPALMVYDLLRHPPLEGVSAFAVRWDGTVMAEA